MSDDPSLELTGGGRVDEAALLETTLPGEELELDPDAEGRDDLQRGSTVGRYTVLERIGSGGMGVVYTAFDPQLDRRIALKVMHPDLQPSRSTSSGGKGRLLREAQSMAKLSHPNVITVHDVGTFGERVFVAMEFIEGYNLRDWLKGDHDWSEVVEAFVRAGRGLAAAHAAGLVHRDFKPDNVLMGRDGRVLVMDFGLARQASIRTTGSGAQQPVTVDRPPLPESPEQASKELSLTRTGALMGTPAYMSPEQHKGEPLGPAADQFSFCVALYEGLYGERPFGGNSVTSLAMNVLDGQIKAPPRDSRVPGWLRQVVLRGLRTDPDDRYPSMDALLADLQQDPPSTRKPWVAVAVALGVGGTIVGAYIAARPKAEEICSRGTSTLDEHWNEDREQRLRDAVLAVEVSYADTTWQSVVGRMDRYRTQWSETYLEQCRADRALQSGRIGHDESPPLVCLHDRLIEFDALVDALSRADPDTVEHAVAASQALTSPTVCGLSEYTEPVALRMGLGPSTQSRIEAVKRGLAEAEVLLRLGRARDAIERAMPLLTASRSMELPGLQAEVDLVLGRAQTATGEDTAGEQTLRDAILAAAASRRYDLEARAWALMMRVVGLLEGHYEQGPRLALAAEAAIARTGDAAHLRADMQMTLGEIEQAEGNYEESLSHFEMALSLRSKELLGDDLAVAEARMAVGAALEGLARFGEATEQHNTVLATREQVLGSQHPSVAVSLLRLGSAMQGAGNLDLAEASLVRARMLLDPRAQIAVDDLPPPGATAPTEPRSRVDAPAHRDLAAVLDQLGLVKRAKEEFDQASRLHARSAALLEHAVGPHHRDLAYPLQNLGLALADLGRHAEAEIHLRRSVEIWKKTIGETHPDLGVGYLNLANTEWALGRAKEAKDDYARAYEIWEGSLPADHALLGYALTGLGRAQIASGEAVPAIDLLERALSIRDHIAEDTLNIAETCLVLARALWVTQRDPQRSFELILRARDIVGAYEPRDTAGLQRVLEGEDVPRFTDQLRPAGLGVSNRRLRLP